MGESRPVSSDGFLSSERLKELAKPKEVKDVWNFSRKLVWGNQETIWPLSSCALLSQPTSRILTLAKPKNKPDRPLQPRPLFVYSCGRESEIWDRPRGLDSVTPSKRILQLAEPRQQYLATYLKQRPRSSPQWPISYSALCCNPSKRVLALAQPRPLHPSFTLPKEAETRVSRAARRASPSLRTDFLAQPVLKQHIVYYDSRCVEAPIRQVSLAAQQAVASPRVAQLAKPKVLPPESAPDRPSAWPVSVAARHAVATPRLEELAQPPKRACIMEGSSSSSSMKLCPFCKHMYEFVGNPSQVVFCKYKAPTHFVQFNPEAFTVKETAKKAICSERIKELAQPVQR